MLKVISKNDISIAIDFTWELSQKPETSSYPLYKEKSKLKENFKRSFLKDSNILLGYYANNELIAVINFFFNESEKYLQTTGVYISSNYNEVMDALMVMLKSKYPNYRALFGFPKENKNANNYFIENGYECIDSCLDMRLSTVNFKGTKQNNNIFKICKSDFDSYAPFHDKYFQGIYWTSNRLKEALDDWNIFVYIQNGTIEGSIFITTCDENTIEIFGLAVSDKYKKKGVEEILLSQALEELFRCNPSIKQTIFFVDDIESEELEMVKRIGFNYFSSYRCYQALL